MSDQPIKIEVSGNVKAGIAKSIRDIGAAALETDASLDILKATLGSFSATTASVFKPATNDVKQFAASINNAGKGQKAFQDTINKTATALNNGAKAADHFAASANKAATATNNLNSRASNLQGSLAPLAGLFATVFSVGKYVEAQDAMTQMDNKIRSLNYSLAESVTVQTALFDIANRTRSSVEATTDGFVRFSKAMANTGATTQEVLRFTETLNKALLTAGRSTAEVSSIVTQLGQALNSGRLQGDEFRSLSENLPREALQAMADELGVGIDKLKEMGTEGKITTDVIRNAFAKLGPVIDKQFAKTIPTISQSFTVLNNKVIEFTQKTTGMAGQVSKAILWIGDNLETLVPIVTGVAAAFALVKLGGLIVDIGLLAAALGPATIQILAFAAGAAAGIATVYSLARAMAYVKGETEQFDQGMRLLVDDVKRFAAEVGAAAQSAVGIDNINNSLRQTAGIMADATAGATTLNDQVTLIGGGQVRVQGTADAMKETAEAAKGLAGTAPGLQNIVDILAAMAATNQKAKDNVNDVAGAVASISGKYTGVINVAEALKENGQNAKMAGQNGKFYTQQLESITGKFTGVTKITEAVDGNTSALDGSTKQANAYADALMRAVGAANALKALEATSTSTRGPYTGASGTNNPRGNSNGNNPTPNPGDTKGSFTNITGNMSGNQDKYARGGSFMVGGRAGNDNAMVRFRAQKGERVDITTAAQQRRAKRKEQSSGQPMQVIYVNIQTPDANSFGRSRAQIASDTLAAMG